MIDLSIIIVSFNTKEVTRKAIESLQKAIQSNSSLKYEIIVVDNNSSDGSVEELKKLQVKLIELSENKGFSVANNIGFFSSKGKYILYLNSDVIIESINFPELLSYIEDNPQVGALTVKVILPKGGIDPASHRGFPTLWRSFCYFTGLERILGRFPIFRKVFGGYHLLHFDLDTVHEIESPSGAFFLTKRSIIEKLHGFDEQFFMYGEDLDLSFRIKQLGYTIIYYPKYSVVHLKSISGLKTGIKTTRKNTRRHFYKAMRIFYAKHYAKQYPEFVNKFIDFFINLKSYFS